MVFKPRQKRENLNIKLEINQWTIDQVKESAFLGVILDENFSWKPHIANIARKVSKSISIIHKASLCLSTSTLCTFHNSLVYPYFLYCIRVWGSTYPSTLKRTVLLQTKVVRITSRSTFNAHTEPIFKQLKILNLYNIYRFQMGNIIFLFDRLFTSCSLKIIFVFEQQSLLLHPTVNSFCIPPLQNKYQTVCVMYPKNKFFNSLNIEIQNVGTLSLCKSELRTLILN